MHNFSKNVTNIQGFRSQLTIREIFILKISLAKLWLVSNREQDTCEQLRGYIHLTLVRDDSKF